MTESPCQTDGIDTDDLPQRHLEAMLGPGATFRDGQREAIRIRQASHQR